MRGQSTNKRKPAVLQNPLPAKRQRQDRQQHQATLFSFYPRKSEAVLDQAQAKGQRQDRQQHPQAQKQAVGGGAIRQSQSNYFSANQDCENERHEGHRGGI